MLWQLNLCVYAPKASSGNSADLYTPKGNSFTPILHFGPSVSFQFRRAYSLCLFNIQTAQDAFLRSQCIIFVMSAYAYVFLTIAIHLFLSV